MVNIKKIVRGNGTSANKLCRMRNEIIFQGQMRILKSKNQGKFDDKFEETKENSLICQNI